MTDDELKKLREEWADKKGYVQAALYLRILGAIDEALSRGAQLKALRNVSAVLDGHCNAHIAMLDEARAALAEATDERDAAMVALEIRTESLANARAVAFEEAARSLEGDVQLTTAIADYCAAKLRRWRDGAARPNGASGQWVAADVMERVTEALRLAAVSLPHLDNRSADAVVGVCVAALSALESGASR